MRGLGKGVKEYKNAVNSVEDELKSSDTQVKDSPKNQPADGNAAK
jgi:Sec-independent protein translocase protein TatA